MRRNPVAVDLPRPVAHGWFGNLPPVVVLPGGPRRVVRLVGPDVGDVVEEGARRVPVGQELDRPVGGPDRRVGPLVYVPGPGVPGVSPDAVADLVGAVAFAGEPPGVVVLASRETRMEDRLLEPDPVARRDRVGLAGQSRPVARLPEEPGKRRLERPGSAVVGRRVDVRGAPAGPETPPGGDRRRRRGIRPGEHRPFADERVQRRRVDQRIAVAVPGNGRIGPDRASPVLVGRDQQHVRSIGHTPATTDSALRLVPVRRPRRGRRSTRPRRYRRRRTPPRRSSRAG